MLFYVIFFFSLFLLLLFVDKSKFIKGLVNRLHKSSYKSGVHKAKRRDHINDDISNKKIKCTTLKNLVKMEMQALRREEDSAMFSRENFGAYSNETASNGRGISIALTTATLAEIEQRKKVRALSMEFGQVNPMHDGNAHIFKGVNLLHETEIDTESNKATVIGTRSDVSMKSATNNFEKDEVLTFGKDYLDYLMDGRTFLGCADILFEGGFGLLWLDLNPGTLEDFILYLCNNHTIMACCYAVKGSPYPRSLRRYAFVSQHVSSFFISNFLIVVATSLGIGSEYNQATAEPGSNYAVNLVLDIFITSPISLLLSEGLRFLYTLQLHRDLLARWPFIGKMINSLGRLLIVPIFFSTFGLLILLCMLTTGMNIWDNIVQYIYSVLMATVLLDIIYSIMAFQTSYFMNVTLFNGTISILTVGKRYLELLLHHNMQHGIHYLDKSYVRLWGMVTVELIFPLNHNDSILKKSMKRKLDSKMSFSRNVTNATTSQYIEEGNTRPSHFLRLSNIFRNNNLSKRFRSSIDSTSSDDVRASNQDEIMVSTDPSGARLMTVHGMTINPMLEMSQMNVLNKGNGVGRNNMHMLHIEKTKNKIKTKNINSESNDESESRTSSTRFFTGFNPMYLGISFAYFHTSFTRFHVYLYK